MEASEPGGALPAPTWFPAPTRTAAVAAAGGASSSSQPDPDGTEEETEVFWIPVLAKAAVVAGAAWAAVGSEKRGIHRTQ